MARVIWKGAISFGLVHIPVALQSATQSQSIDFDWLDQRSMEPVGYKRVNKVTGKEITAEHVVKGVEYEKGRYVILTEEEIKTAHPTSTQTIDIFSFIDSEQIPLTTIDTPYYLAPDKRGEKVYALLRETLSETKKVALAYVILHTRQHLAALMPMEAALVLVLLRWPDEVRDLDTLALTKSTSDAALSKSEMEMAKRLVGDMAGAWNPDEYRDTFHDKIMELVEMKAREGKIENVETNLGESERKTADIIDLTEILKRSLRGGGNSTSQKSLAKPKVSENKKSTTSKTGKRSRETAITESQAKKKETSKIKNSKRDAIKKETSKTVSAKKERGDGSEKPISKAKNKSTSSLESSGTVKATKKSAR